MVEFAHDLGQDARPAVLGLARNLVERLMVLLTPARPAIAWVAGIGQQQAALPRIAP